ncbi:MAG: ribosome recycling factor [Methylophilaceae bacterium]|jgi:ribosome recycling factor
MNELKSKMEKTVEKLKSDFSKIRTGRAHTGILDHLTVDYYGTNTPLSQMANITLGDNVTINVQPYDKSQISAIEKAIRDSDLGLNPAVNGDLIRVPMPPLTEERRRDLIKVIKSEGENSKVAIRNIRRDGNDDLKKQLKEKLISEDDEKRDQARIQSLTDDFIKTIDSLIAAKEKDLLEI